MGIIFDSSVLIYLERNFGQVEKIISGREKEPFGISVITVSELLHGVYRADSGKRRLKREAFVEKVIELFPIYPFDLDAARIYARIWANLVKKGMTIGSHDLIIGATCISLGFSVATSDIRDFERIPGLQKINLSLSNDEPLAIIAALPVFLLRLMPCAFCISVIGMS